MNQTNKPHSRKYALTGRLRSGKDFAAKKCGGSILGFADPLYAVGEALFGLGVEEKDNPKYNLRGFYQKLGEWGKGTIDEQHPLTMERASFVLMMRAFGSNLVPNLAVDWASYGHNKNIWLESLLGRAFVETGEQSAPIDGPFYPVKDVFVTNVRYKFELQELQRSDFDHFHSMCSEQTYIERLRQVGMTLGDQRLKHISEMLANELDREVQNIIRLHPTGPKLKVIWNDHRPCPNERLFTLEEFQSYVKQNGERSQDNPTPSPAEETVGTDAGQSPGDVEPVREETTARATGSGKSRKGSRTRKNS